MHIVFITNKVFFPLIINFCISSDLYANTICSEKIMILSCEELILLKDGC